MQEQNAASLPNSITKIKFILHTIRNPSILPWSPAPQSVESSRTQIQKFDKTKEKDPKNRQI